MYSLNRDYSFGMTEAIMDCTEFKTKVPKRGLWRTKATGPQHVENDRYVPLSCCRGVEGLCPARAPRMLSLRSSVFGMVAEFEPGG